MALSNTTLLCPVIRNAGVAFALSFMTVNSVAATTVAADHVTEVVCRLSIPAQLAREQPAVLTLTLHNRGKQSLHLLKRNTPLEGWLADSMTVERDGLGVPYIGAMAKRMPPSASEYLHLKAGARHAHRIKLQDAYDVAPPGSYRVVWRGEVMDVFTVRGKPNPEHMSPQVIACPAATFIRSP